MLGEGICTERTSIASVGGKQGKVCGMSASLFDVSGKFCLQSAVEVNGSCMVMLGAMCNLCYAGTAGEQDGHTHAGSADGQ